MELYRSVWCIVAYNRLKSYKSHRKLFPAVFILWLVFSRSPCSPSMQKEIRLQMAEKAKTGDLKAVNGSAASQAAAAAAAAKRKRRWDQTAEKQDQSGTPSNAGTPKKMSSWDQADQAAEVKLILVDQIQFVSLQL